MQERLYYADSFLKTFPAQVADIREASRGDAGSIWQIALDRTAFYPTSGGQPHDIGTLTATSRTGAILEVAVESVEEDEHGTIWHTTRKPLLAGTSVHGTIDWPRRLDHIQQHSGQHLLSAVFARELDAPTVSFHLGETESTIDLVVSPIAHHSLERIERIANELIAEDRLVSIRAIAQSEAEALLQAGKLRKLPEREGTIRLIEIEDYDLNACGGTHVRSTGQIGSLVVRGAEKTSRGTRVTFVCGLRAVAAARHDATLLQTTAASLSIGPNDLPRAIERLKSEAKLLEKERQHLCLETATYHAAALAVEEQSQNNLRLVNRSFPDRDKEYVRLLASRLTAAVPRTVAILVAEEEPSAGLVLARSGDLGFHCGELLRETLKTHGLRGGGSPDLAQADIPMEHLKAVCDELAAIIRHRCTTMLMA